MERKRSDMNSNSLYNTKVKQRSRDKLLNFIRKRLKRIDAKDMKVFCLPGAEAIEIFKIYDKLGIPRQNIVCVERVKKHYDELVRLNLGVNVHYTTVNNYFRTHPNEKFHVVSLDYMGMLSSHIDDLRVMTRFGHLHEECIVFTNFCGAREKAQQKALYFQYGEHQNESVLDDIEQLRDSAWVVIRNEIEGNGAINYLDLVAYEELHLAKVKEVELQRAEKSINELALNGEDPEKIEIFKITIENLRNNDQLSGYIYKYARSAIQHTIGTLFKLKFELKREDETPGERTRYDDLYFVAFKDDEGSPRTHLDERTRMPARGAIEVLRVSVKEYFGKERHLVYDTKSYRYVGYSGVPMLSDMYYLKKMHSYDKTLEGMLNDSGETVAEILFPFFNKHSALQIAETVIKCKKMKFSEPEIEKPDRDCLGYESKINPRPESDYSNEYDLEILEAEVTAEPVTVSPPSLEPVSEETDGQEKQSNFSMESKIREARSLVLSHPEMTSYEIAEKTGARVMTVAALKAHRTRGTYDEFEDTKSELTG
jgi:hypothetical protein